jgi:ribulose-phosphate 3-epimerase
VQITDRLPNKEGKMAEVGSFAPNRYNGSMSLPIRVAPSLLACDFTRLGAEMARAETAGADWHHVDVMDGHFVPNLSIGLPVVESIKKVSKLPLDVHLMIEQPGEWAERYAAAGADILTFHYEACTANFTATLAAFQATGCRVGVSINGGTEPEPLRPYLDQIDMVLVMSVYAGFGGQKFIPECLGRIEKLRSWGFKGDIQVDGGITDQTVGRCTKAGANVFVAGTYLYRADSLAEAMHRLRAAGEAGRVAENDANAS